MYLSVNLVHKKGGYDMKKLLSLVLILAMVMTFAVGCGKSTDEPSNDDGKKTFLIGGSGPLTGDAASYGLSVKQGAIVAIEEINAAGGVTVGDTTYELELAFEDDEAGEEKAVSAYNTLMDKGINVFMGTVTSGACLAVTSLTRDDGILQITPSGSAQGCTEFDNAFRICFTDPLQGEIMAEYAVETLGLKKVAVIYHSDSDYSQGMKDAFADKVVELGGEIVASEASSENDIDFKTQLTSIKNSGAEIIFFPGYYQEATYITQQAKDLGMNIPFIGGDGWDGLLKTVTDMSTIEGSVFLSPFFTEDPASADFVSAYEEAYGEIPDQFAADGYDAVYVIKAAMEKAGTIENEDLIAAMTEISVVGVTGSMTFTPEGEPNKEAKFIKIVNGKYTLLQ